MEYFTAVDLLSCVALVNLAILVRENSRIEKSAKRKFYITYITIAAAMFAEWAGIILNGMPEWTRVPHIIVKCLDYAITPVAGICFASQVAKKNRIRSFMWLVLGLNALFQFCSIFTGWTFYLDEANYYHHGPLYFLYVAVYCIAIAVVMWEFMQYGKNYKRRNRASLYSIVGFVGVGIILQEIFSMRTSYLTMIFSSILLFIHYSEFSQLKSDEVLEIQKELLETDVLTGLYSRYAYNEALRDYNELPELPEKLVVFSIDINELKSTNDRLGHLAGDDLIKGAAQCITAALSPYGKCFRTGGDEFIALLEMDEQEISAAAAKLNQLTAQWRGKLVSRVSLSMGTSSRRDNPDITLQKLISLADEQMYSDKNAYYSQPGKDRRTR